MKLSRKTVLFCAALVALATVSTASAQLEVVTNNGANPNPLDAACVKSGEYAMRISTVTGDATPRFVLAGAANGFNDETVFRAQFWFNPRDMFIRHGFRHFLLETLPGTTQYGAVLGILSPFRVSLFRNQFTGEYKVEMGCRANCFDPATCGSAATFPRLTLGTGNAWSLIQVEWAHNTPGLFDAVCRISIIDGAGAGQFAEVSGLSNRFYSIDSCKLGFIGGVFIDPQTDGSHCYDDFQSFRTLAP